VGGLLYGSVLAVLVDRVPTRKPIRTAVSTCTACGATIAPKRRLFGYLTGSGSCPACGVSDRWTAPVIELVSAGLAVGAAATFASNYWAILTAAFLGVLVALALIDARHRLLPNAIIYPSAAAFAALIVIGALTEQGSSPIRAVVGALVYGAPLLLLAMVSPGGMGMGDVKLAALIGLVLASLGWRYVGVAAVLGAFSGGIGSVVVLAAGRSRKATIPFGPYLAVGAILATLFAPQIARAYG
jgi:leader peptidase (prepilin peptidase)/N-methyltransferase